MSKLKHLPAQVERLAKVAKIYEKMGIDAIAVPKLERLFNIEVLKNNFNSLQRLSIEGLVLGNYFYDVHDFILKKVINPKIEKLENNRKRIQLEKERKKYLTADIRASAADSIANLLQQPLLSWQRHRRLSFWDIETFMRRYFSLWKIFFTQVHYRNKKYIYN